MSADTTPVIFSWLGLWIVMIVQNAEELDNIYKKLGIKMISNIGLKYFKFKTKQEAINFGNKLYKDYNWMAEYPPLIIDGDVKDYFDKRIFKEDLIENEMSSSEIRDFFNV